MCSHFSGTVTQDQYEIVKDIILDLLGWGVPPTYLIDCGVSREAIFYVFSELNLALPEHFDVSAFVPYLPIPPQSLPESQKNSVDQQSHLGYPPSVVHSPLAQACPIYFGRSSPVMDLHTIERQRRQELLARKAAHATCRPRHSASIDSSNSAMSFSLSQEQSGTTPASPTEAVDNFLNSIGSISRVGASPPSAFLYSDRQDTSNKMDVEKVIGSSVTDPHLRDSPSRASSALVQDSWTVEQTPPSSAEVSTTLNIARASSSSADAAVTSASSSTLSQASDPEQGAQSHVHSVSHAQTSLPSRRGVKRAVATDFDFDAAPRKNGSSQLPAKQPRTTFGNIGSRRCVIELSDSEGEDGSERHLPPPSFSEQTLPRRNKPNAYSSPSANKPTPGSSVSPSALLQKELEIQKMREMIARCEEETRIKKLAVSVCS